MFKNALGSDKYCCSDCPAAFDKTSKLIFHQHHCNKASPSSELNVVSSNEIGPSIESEKNVGLEIYFGSGKKTFLKSSE